MRLSGWGWRRGTSMPPLPASTLLPAGMARIRYQWNDLEAAAALAGQALTLCRRWGFVESMVHCCQSLAWIYRAQGDVDRAQALRQEADEIALRRALFPHSEHGWAASRMRWWTAHGQCDQAARFAEERRLSPDAQITPTNEGEYLCLARLQLAQGETGHALRLLERLLDTFLLAGRTGRLIEALVLQSLTFQASGEHARADEAIGRALALAQPEGYVRLFVDEGPAVAQLLQGVRGNVGQGLAVYVDRLLGAFGQEEVQSAAAHPAPLIEPLNTRELQILRLIAAGMTYQEIARELIIAVSTVQTYVRSLYPKLGVHSGLEAVARGRQLGLLPP